MDKKLEQLHATVSTLLDTLMQLRQENEKLKNTAAQLSLQKCQLQQQYDEEVAHARAYRETTQQVLMKTTEDLREILVRMPEEYQKGNLP